MLFLSFFMAACTRPNPRSCLDGSCSDNQYPFCDVDGSVAGKPGECIAIECMSGAFELCRDDMAITCNTTGSNFDLIQCPLGCTEMAEGCRECTEDSQCPSPAPICDADTTQCRQCRTDDECPSRVCNVDEGTCVAESSVVYASPTGEGQLCKKESPCSVATAVMVVTDAGASMIRMLPGTYTRGLDVRVPTNPLIRIVATGATITLVDATPAILVTGGASVEVRGIDVVSQKAIACGGATAAMSTLSFRRSNITVLGNLSGVLDVVRCALTIFEADVSLGGSEIAISLLDDATLKADRMFLHGSTSHHIFASGLRIKLQVTTSLFVDVGLAIEFGTTGEFTMAQDTFVYTEFALQNGCEGAASALRTVRYENSILAPLGQFDAVSGSNCTFHNVLLSRQSTAPPGTFVADPQFAEPTMRDFHLKSTSPAVDKSEPSILGLDSKIDLDGRPRPQGAKTDLGAYEH